MNRREFAALESRSLSLNNPPSIKIAASAHDNVLSSLVKVPYVFTMLKSRIIR
jgi:hypothetical protein